MTAAAHTLFDEPVRGGYPDAAALAFTGPERLAMFGTRIPAPPYAHLVGIALEDVGDGTTVTTMPATGWLRSPQGRIPVGAVAILADVSLGSALETRLGPGALYTTSDLALQRLGTPAASGRLRAAGRVVYSGADVALTETAVTDGEGRLVVHGTSRLSMLPPLAAGDLPATDALPPFEPPVHDSPDPYERDAPGDTIPEDEWQRRSGLEIVQAQIAGELPAAPLSHLTGIAPTHAEKGSVVVAMPAHPWLTNHLGTVHGGFLATLADAALQLAIQTTTDAGHGFAPLDFKLNYLRPVSPDGNPVEARGTVAHRGRSMAVASVELVDARDRRVAMATGAAMFGPRELL